MVSVDTDDVITPVVPVLVVSVDEMVPDILLVVSPGEYVLELSGVGTVVDKGTGVDIIVGTGMCWVLLSLVVSSVTPVVILSVGAPSVLGATTGPSENTVSGGVHPNAS